MSGSCAGCKFLFLQDCGYSNYTVEDTEIDCLLNKNKFFPADLPFNWSEDPENDNWGNTSESRCEKYELGEYISLDVDGEITPEDCTNDNDVLVAFYKNKYQGR